MYSVNEQASTLAFLTYDPSTGTLTPVKEVSALPAGFAGTSFASAVLMAADGKFIYVSNRLHDSIAVFSVTPSGEPTLVWDEWTRADYPRSLAIDPTGKFLYSCNHRGDSITVFRLESGGAKLQFTGHYVAVGSPACMVFV